MSIKSSEQAKPQIFCCLPCLQVTASKCIFAKGHLISKAIYDLLTSSKKQTDLIWFVIREELKS